MTGPCLVQLWFPVYNTVAGSLSQAAVLLGCSVTASASGRVPKAVHFLNSGRKQSGRAGAAGQQGSPEETCSPAAGGRGVCQGEEGGRRLASPRGADRSQHRRGLAFPLPSILWGSSFVGVLLGKEPGSFFFWPWISFCGWPQHHNKVRSRWLCRVGVSKEQI